MAFRYREWEAILFYWRTTITYVLQCLMISWTFEKSLRRCCAKAASNASRYLHVVIRMSTRMEYCTRNCRWCQQFSSLSARLLRVAGCSVRFCHLPHSEPQQYGFKEAYLLRKFGAVYIWRSTDCNFFFLTCLLKHSPVELSGYI